MAEPTAAASKEVKINDEGSLTLGWTRRRRRGRTRRGAARSCPPSVAGTPGTISNSAQLTGCTTRDY